MEGSQSRKRVFRDRIGQGGRTHKGACALRRIIRCKFHGITGQVGREILEGHAAQHILRQIRQIDQAAVGIAVCVGILIDVILGRILVIVDIAGDLAVHRFRDKKSAIRRIDLCFQPVVPCAQHIVCEIHRNGQRPVGHLGNIRDTVPRTVAPEDTPRGEGRRTGVSAVIPAVCDDIIRAGHIGFPEGHSTPAAAVTGRVIGKCDIAVGVLPTELRRKVDTDSATIEPVPHDLYIGIPESISFGLKEDRSVGDMVIEKGRNVETVADHDNIVYHGSRATGELDHIGMRRRICGAAVRQIAMFDEQVVPPFEVVTSDIMNIRIGKRIIASVDECGFTALSLHIRDGHAAAPLMLDPIMARGGIQIKIGQDHRFRRLYTDVARKGKTGKNIPILTDGCIGDQHRGITRCLQIRIFCQKRNQFRFGAAIAGIVFVRHDIAGIRRGIERRLLPLFAVVTECLEGNGRLAEIGIPGKVLHTHGENDRKCRKFRERILGKIKADLIRIQCGTADRGNGYRLSRRVGHTQLCQVEGRGIDIMRECEGQDPVPLQIAAGIAGILLKFGSIQIQISRLAEQSIVDEKTAGERRFTRLSGDGIEQLHGPGLGHTVRDSPLLQADERVSGRIGHGAEEGNARRMCLGIIYQYDPHPCTCRAGRRRAARERDRVILTHTGHRKLLGAEQCAGKEIGRDSGLGLRGARQQKVEGNEPILLRVEKTLGHGILHSGGALRHTAETDGIPVDQGVCRPAVTSGIGAVPPVRRTG